MFICILLSFVFIYLMVFFGGWKLIESGNPILIEIAVSILVGIIIGLIFEFSRYYEIKLKEMKKQIEELEKSIEELKNK